MFSSEKDVEFFLSLPPLNNSNSKSSFIEAEMEADQRLYCLAFIDEATGKAIRPATDEDLVNLLEEDYPEADQSQSLEQLRPLSNVPSFAEILAASQAQRNTACMHCGVSESPQWRKGPPHKPLLCNACGTRYRRTNQLGPAIPPSQRKQHRFTPQDCAQEVAAAAKGRVSSITKPRLVA